ncbi:hypothetical protein QVD17_16440 [Tagetes erecta]|uniref:Uncharacterized protein n=1 Tax=Tagetes erecta TaxID=13708 RepID=A0AAD8KV71_TARER|nr:hypothetical protein QVD17_16440 [Tagetes erecta]
MSILPVFTENRDISKLDWCSLIYSNIHECKLMHVDATTCNDIQVDRRDFALAEWNMSKLRERQKIELQNGGFGVVKKQDLFLSGEDINEGDCVAEVNMPDQSPSKQEFVSKLKGLLSSIEKEKNEFEKIKIIATGKHSDDQELMCLVKEYYKMFGTVGDTPIVGDENQAGEKDDDSSKNNQKGKELMLVEEEHVSQFWNDTQMIRLVCETVDREATALLSNNQGLIHVEVSELEKPFHGEAEFIEKACGGKPQPSELQKSLFENQDITLVMPSYSLGLTQIYTPPEVKTPTHATPEDVESEDDDNAVLSVIQKRLRKDVTCF